MRLCNYHLFTLAKLKQLMRILLLSDINSSHTKRWAIDLTEKGLDIAIFSFVDPIDEWFKTYNIKVSSLGLQKRKSGGSTTLSKFKYIYLIPKVKKFIKAFSPDIIHAHFLTSYGVLANRLNFHPFIISVWGSDVFFDLENKKLLQKEMKSALKKADLICSTSKTMALPLLPYRNDVKVIPFGVNIELFHPNKDHQNRSKIIIGTVKSLKPIYGIDNLIKAFFEVNKRLPDIDIELHIYGDGPEKEQYYELVKKLELTEKVIFHGSIPNSNVPKALNTLDIFANLSDFESFGVSVLEASACALPVVATSIGGLKEVVLNNESGFLVNKDDINDTIEKLILLIQDEKLRISMGNKGREFVIENYNITQTTQMMIDIYSSLT